MYIEKINPLIHKMNLLLIQILTSNQISCTQHKYKYMYFNIYVPYNSKLIFYSVCTWNCTQIDSEVMDVDALVLIYMYVLAIIFPEKNFMKWNLQI